MKFGIGGGPRPLGGCCVIRPKPAPGPFCSVVPLVRLISDLEQDVGVAGHVERAPAAQVPFRKIAPTAKIRIADKPNTAGCAPGKRRPIMGVTRDRPLQQAERLWKIISRKEIHRIGTKIEIIGCKIRGRPPD